MFVKLDEDIHGLAHVSQLGLSPKDKITEIFKPNEEKEFEIVNISPAEHRLGLKLATPESAEKPKVKKTSKKEKVETEEAVEDTTEKAE